MVAPGVRRAFLLVVSLRHRLGDEIGHWAVRLFWPLPSRPPAVSALRSRCAYSPATLPSRGRPRTPVACHVVAADIDRPEFVAADAAQQHLLAPASVSNCHPLPTFVREMGNGHCLLPITSSCRSVSWGPSARTAQWRWPSFRGPVDPRPGRPMTGPLDVGTEHCRELPSVVGLERIRTASAASSGVAKRVRSGAGAGGHAASRNSIRPTTAVRMRWSRRFMSVLLRALSPPAGCCCGWSFPAHSGPSRAAALVTGGAGWDCVSPDSTALWTAACAWLACGLPRRCCWPCSAAATALTAGRALPLRLVAA